ncbi:MAG TPA: thiol-disulfide oxidoreductase DCC family protein [Tepidisphaeraceae bacterium]|nr:thiol-disulfide oxidoreductase DCC family protein [Tepidisphaeraceae bacterium]
MPRARPEPSIVLFDGVCNFCEASVQFVIDRDPRGRFAFAPLQSPTGRRLLAAHGLDGGAIDSVVLVERGRAYAKSAAALRIGVGLGWPWALACVGFAIPEGLRDAVYDGFAKRRYRWFGKKDACRMPTPELRARFVDEV